MSTEMYVVIWTAVATLVASIILSYIPLKTIL